MLIYGSAILPVLFTIYMLVYHRKSVKVWEIAAQFGVAILVMFIVKVCADVGRTTDTEWWGNLATEVQHDEDWNEKVYYYVQVADGQV